MKDFTKELVGKMSEILSKEEITYSIDDKDGKIPMRMINSVLGKVRAYDVSSVSDIESNYETLRVKSKIPFSVTLFGLGLFFKTYRCPTMKKYRVLVSEYSQLRRDLIGENELSLEMNFNLGYIYGVYLRNFRELTTNPLFSACQFDVKDSTGTIKAIAIYDEFFEKMLRSPQISALTAIAHSRKEQLDEAQRAPDNTLFDLSFNVVDPDYVMHRHDLRRIEWLYTKRGKMLQVDNIHRTSGGGRSVKPDLITPFPFIRI